MRCVSVPITLLLLSLTAAALAQEQHGSISGTVREPTGAPAASVRIEARHVSTGMVAGTTTDAEGFYLFPTLVPGRYEIAADPAGPAPTRVAQVALLIGSLLRIDLTLGRGVIEPAAPDAGATLPD